MDKVIESRKGPMIGGQVTRNADSIEYIQIMELP